MSSFSFSFMLYLTDPNLEPVGAGTRQTAVVINNNKNLLPVEIYVTKRSYNLQGKEVLTEVEDDFVIIPNQLLLQPGEEKMLTVVWNGPTTLSSEAAYRLVGEEFPLPEEIVDPAPRSSMAQLKVLRKIMRAMYVNLPTFKPEIVLDSFIGRSLKYRIRTNYTFKDS